MDTYLKEIRIKVMDLANKLRKENNLTNQLL